MTSETPGIKIVRPMPRSGITMRDGRDRDAATRLLLVSFRDRGLRCAPPPAIRFTPLRGGLPVDSHHPARSLIPRNRNAPWPGTLAPQKMKAAMNCRTPNRLVSYGNVHFPENAADHGCCRCQERSKTPADARLPPAGHRAGRRGSGHGRRSLSAAAGRSLVGHRRGGLGGWFMLWRKRRNPAASVVLLLAGLALAASWHHCRWNLFGGDDLGLFARTQQQPVCIEAVALQTPRVIPPPAFNPLRFARPGEEVRFEVELRAIRDGDQWRTASGRAAMVVEGLLPGPGRGRPLPGLCPSLAARTCPEPGRGRSRGPAIAAAASPATCG